MAIILLEHQLVIPFSSLQEHITHWFPTSSTPSFSFSATPLLSHTNFSSLTQVDQKIKRVVLFFILIYYFASLLTVSFKPKTTFQAPKNPHLFDRTRQRQAIKAVRHKSLKDVNRVGRISGVLIWNRDSSPLAIELGTKFCRDLFCWWEFKIQIYPDLLFGKRYFYLNLFFGWNLGYFLCQLSIRVGLGSVNPDPSCQDC